MMSLPFVVVCVVMLKVLANVNAMKSEEFAKDRFPGGKPVGKVDMSKTNLWGGSLAVGTFYGVVDMALCVSIFCY